MARWWRIRSGSTLREICNHRMLAQLRVDLFTGVRLQGCALILMLTV